MDTIPKFLASAFVIIIAVFIGISLILSGTSVVSARTFYSNVADAIGSVNPIHEAEIIEECTLLAEDNGYVLKTEKVETVDSKYYYAVTLEYSFFAPFFGNMHKGTVSGYVYPGAHFQAT